MSWWADELSILSDISAYIYLIGITQINRKENVGPDLSIFNHVFEQWTNRSLCGSNLKPEGYFLAFSVCHVCHICMPHKQCRTTSGAKRVCIPGFMFKFVNHKLSLLGNSLLQLLLCHTLYLTDIPLCFCSQSVKIEQGWRTSVLRGRKFHLLKENMWWISFL